jgi:hypothetical protein
VKVVTCFYAFSISKYLMKVIQRTILAVILTVKTLWLLRMHPRCRTPERARSHHKFKGVPGSYAVRSRLKSLHAFSDWKTAGPEGDDENEDRISKINTCLQRLLDAQFETLFEKRHRNVKKKCTFLQSELKRGST